MKIIGFSQLRNELSKGNLENWFKQMSVCDHIYIYDQASDDGSKDYYKQFEKAIVLESPVNDFKRELICKQTLYNKVITDHPDTDWILWLDGDLLLDGRLLSNNGQGLKNLCQLGSQHGIGGFMFGHYNLWRSDVRYRYDEGYHGLHGGWLPLWRNNGQLRFGTAETLHQPQYPLNLGPIAQAGDYSVIHRGFATDDQIMTKYHTYKGFGQHGWDLDRLLDERILATEVIPSGILPEWFEVKDSKDPREKRKIIEIYKEKYGEL